MSKLSHAASPAGAASPTAPTPPPRVAVWPRRRHPSGLGRLTRRTSLLVVVAAAILVGAHPGRPGAVVVDPDLVRLLRFMALLKAGLAGAAIAALFWRLADPVGLVRLAAYLAAAAATAAGPGMIWTVDHLVLGAALLHGGLAALVVLLWRDPAMPARLVAFLQSRPRSPNGSQRTGG